MQNFLLVPSVLSVLDLFLRAQLDQLVHQRLLAPLIQLQLNLDLRAQLDQLVLQH
jgi:hypothetical protein